MIPKDCRKCGYFIKFKIVKRWPYIVLPHCYVCYHWHTNCADYVDLNKIKSMMKETPNT